MSYTRKIMNLNNTALFQSQAKPGLCLDVVLHEAFLGVVEDERGRVVTTENDRYIQGQYCRLGKVLFCYEDKVLISGFDKKPHMVLADMAAMQRIRDRITEEQAAKERAGLSRPQRDLSQGQNMEKPVPVSEEKSGLFSGQRKAITP